MHRGYATAPSSPTAPSGIFGLIWSGSAVFATKFVSGTSKSTAEMSQNPISIDLDRICTLFCNFGKNPKSAQIAPSWGVEFLRYDLSTQTPYSLLVVLRR